MKIEFSYRDVPPIELLDENIIGVYSPRKVSIKESEEAIIKRGFENPIGTPPISKMAKGKKKILILVDDNTRMTPVPRIIPHLSDELTKAGISKEQIKILVALGTHRKMSKEELGEKLGRVVCEEYQVLQHEWDNETSLKYIGNTSSGMEVWVNKLALEVDFIIGLGHIVPHRATGFSGGGKIILPGICGAKTTGQLHWIAAHYKAGEIIGKLDNPVRTEIEKIARMVGLDVIVNVVQDSSGQIVELVVGSMIKAHRKGAAVSKEVYGVRIPAKADIVIVESYPADIEFWQACKAVDAASLVVKKGGVIIVVTPCPEGISIEHPTILDHDYSSPTRVERLVNSGRLDDLSVASHLVEVGKAIEKKKVIMVSKGIGAAIAKKLGFLHKETPQEAVNTAFDLQGEKAKAIVLKQGGEILPLI